MDLIDAVTKKFLLFICRILFRVQYEGISNVPPKGSCIIVPNHVSYADPVWVSLPIKRRIRYMAWERLFRIPILGMLMRFYGAFPVNVDAVDVSARKSALDVIARGDALMVFPEGGRTKTGELMDFRLGAFRLALNQGISIVPVSIIGARNIWPVGRLLPRPGRLRIIFHPLIPVGKIQDVTPRQELKVLARELAEKTRDAILNNKNDRSQCN